MMARRAPFIVDLLSAAAQRAWIFIGTDAFFFLGALILIIGGRPAITIAQQADTLESERIGRVNDHLTSTDRMVEDSRAQIKQIQIQFRDLEAQVNEWKGAEDVWLKIISLLAGTGIVFQLSSKFGRANQMATDLTATKAALLALQSRPDDQGAIDKDQTVKG
jgi:hypothetical protein